MTFSLLMLLLALAAAVHNLEEWRGYEEWVQTYHQRLNARLNDRWVFRFALILLTVLIVAVAVLHSITGGLTAVCKLIVFALLVNAVGHCCTSVYKRRLVPGTLSALFLMLPLAGAEVYVMHRTFADSFVGLLVYVAGSGLMIPVVVYCSLWVGFGAKRLFASKRDTGHPLL